MKPRTASQVRRRNALALTLAGSITVLFGLPQAQAADKIKANNTDNLNLATSWTSTPATGISDVANWTNTVAGDNNVALGANLGWQGIKIVAPGGLVTISDPTYALTLGDQGINMTAATADLTLSSNFVTQKYLGQVWNLATGRTLTLNTGTFTRGAFSTLNIQGTGSVMASGLANDATGVLGNWAFYGTGATSNYVTNSGGSLVAYTGGTAAATAEEITSTTGLVNYDLAAGGTLGTGASFNTLRYTGATGTVAGDFSVNGILNSGTGGLTLAGNLAIGSGRQLVLASPDNTARILTLSGIVSDNPGGASDVVVADGNTLNNLSNILNKVTLSGANTYTGQTVVSRGALYISNGNALGSTISGTRLTSGGQAKTDGAQGGALFLDNVTTAEPLFLDTTGNHILLFSNGTTVNTVESTVYLGNSMRTSCGTGGVTFKGGLVMTVGNPGTYFLPQGKWTVTDQPIILGSNGTLYMDQTGAKTISVAGNVWGSYSGYGNSTKTTVSGALPWHALFTLGNPNGVLDLFGTSQTVGEFRCQDAITTKLIQNTAGTAAYLTLQQTVATNIDAKLAGNLNLAKTGVGTVSLLAKSDAEGANAYTGGVAVNGGTLNLNFGVAYDSTTLALVDWLPPTTPLTVGGGTLKVTGRNGTATAFTATTGNNSNLLTAVSSIAGLAPGQVITGAGIPANAYIVNIIPNGTNNLSQNRIYISANATAAGTVSLTPVAVAFTNAQTVAGLTVNPGTSSVKVDANSADVPATVLNLNAITRNPGGAVNFTLPAGTQSATNGITTTTANDATGLLGAWAYNGTGTASFYATVSAGNIVNYTSGTAAATAAAITDTTGMVNYDVAAEDDMGAGAAFNTLRYTGDSGWIGGDASLNGVLNSGNGPLTLSGTLTIGANKELTLISPDANRTISLYGIVADNAGGASSVTVGGGGQITVSEGNTYTGKTYVTAGTLQVSSDNCLGAPPAAATEGQLTLAGGRLRATLELVLNANRGVAVTDAWQSQIDTSMGSVTINGVLSGTGRLLKTSAGNSLILNGANTFSGFLDFGQGFGTSNKIVLGNVNALQNATLNTGANDSQSVAFAAEGSNTYNIGGLTGNDLLDLGGNSISVGANNTTNVTYNGVIAGTGGLTKVGTGTLGLNAANTYSGDTVVNGGSLVVYHLNALQNSTLDTGAAGSQRALFAVADGSVANLGGLKGSDELDMAVCHLSIGSNSQDTVFSGTLKGAFGNNLLKTGTGKLTLAGPATYTGTTTVNGGTLEIAADKTYAGAISIDGGTFTLANGGSVKLDVGNHAIGGTGTATLAGTLTVNTGGVTATTGTWTLVNMGTLAPASAFASTFALTDFTAGGDGITWTKTDGGKTWSFSETTGVLTLTSGGGGGTFASWIAGFDFAAFPGADLSFTGDADQDGIANGVEFVIGNLPNQTKVENLPVLTAVTNPDGLPAGDYLKFSYRRTTASATAGVTSQAQYDTDLAGAWTAALDGTAGVEIVETANGAIPGTDVEVFIPRTLAENGHLFARLAAVPAP